MTFGAIKEGIVELLEERLGSFCSNKVALIGACSLTFKEFRACGAPDYYRDKDPIASR